MTRPTLADYIADLGYCCPYGFFRLYPGPKWTQLIADRLGVDVRSVRAVRAQCTICPKATGCRAAAISRKLAAESDSPPLERSKH